MTRRQFGISVASAAALAATSVKVMAAESPSTSVAVLGLAHPHATGFVQTIAKRANMKVAAVWDSQPALADPIAKQTGARIAKDPQSIWQDSSISAAVICAPTSQHLELVLAAAAAKKHVYVEKPLGVGGNDSLAMADAIEKAGVIFQTGYVFRGEGINLFLREQIKAGVFGTITRARCCNANGGLLTASLTPANPQAG